jgi:hypothetical protein
MCYVVAHGVGNGRTLEERRLDPRTALWCDVLSVLDLHASA